MAQKVNPQACFLVTRSSLTFFSKASDDGVELSLTSEIVKDLEMISQQALERVMSSWMEQIKIPAGQVELILDKSVFFHTTINKMPESETDPLVQSFLELVPFTDVITKSFPIKEGAYLVVINREFLNPLIAVLEKFGFVVVSASPLFILGTDDLTKTPFTKEMALKAISNYELLAEYSFIAPEIVEEKLSAPQPFLSVKLNGKLIAMIAIFAILITVLIVLLVTM